MASVRIVTDSHSSITPQEAEKLGITVLPMRFSVDGEECFEGITLTREMFFKKLAEGADVKSSQPAPQYLINSWEKLLNDCDELVYIPISSGISGSCATAQVLASEEQFGGRVFVVDNGRVATPMYRSVLDAVELAGEGYTGAEIKRMLEAQRADMTIYVALDTLEHLKKGGRISGTTAALGTLLNIKPIAQFDVGDLHVYKKCRSMKAARVAMIEALRHDLETKFKSFYDEGNVYIQAAYSTDENTAADWVHEIEAAFPGYEVLSAPLSLAVCCHIGENSLGIGCSCKIKR